MFPCDYLVDFHTLIRYFKLVKQSQPVLSSSSNQFQKMHFLATINLKPTIISCVLRYREGRAPFKSQTIFVYILSQINSEFSFIQLLVHQKRASLYQDLPWLQRMLVVTIMLNTMTSLSHYHLCFRQTTWNQTLSVVLQTIGHITASPSPSPFLRTTHSTPSLSLPPCVPSLLVQHTHLTSSHSQPAQSG